MKDLHFKYRLHSSFSFPVTEHSFSLRCFPLSNEIQRITILKKEITPVDWVSEGRDSFGNEYIYGKKSDAHTEFLVQVEGTACISRGEGEGMSKTSSFLRCYPTELTLCSKEMKELAQSLRRKWYRDEKTPQDFKGMLFELMQWIYDRMEYVPGSTGIHTTAGEAFSQRKGVCQDYAHIMIAICRFLSIPACYVTGFMTGEGASHAWVAAADIRENCWYEIDPTNNRWVDENYIMVSCGMDASDCIMNRGIYCGAAAESQEVTVIVEETL